MNPSDVDFRARIGDTGLGPEREFLFVGGPFDGQTVPLATHPHEGTPPDVAEFRCPKGCHSAIYLRQQLGVRSEYWFDEDASSNAQEFADE